MVTLIDMSPAELQIQKFFKDFAEKWEEEEDEDAQYVNENEFF